ncbi:Fatty acid-binding protein [Sarcoptes scabiei]|uniref:Fatty acid-binding protein n=1 Tax=Sarcoptes scabiei TaxID=52283 RepID=A0A132A7A5_SARSC|nr:Fatty acid-binding protein [Sarcoptes scabiei]KPM06300.1 Lipocalin-like protein 2 [Sarcoptes scabiei]
MSHIEGKFKLEKSENFDNFLKELGVNFVSRNLAKTASPTLIVTIDNDNYTIRTESIRSSEIKFKLNQEFEESRMDGSKCISTVVKEGDNRLVQTQKGDKEVKIEREFGPDGVMVIASCNGVVSNRFYKRL